MRLGTTVTLALGREGNPGGQHVLEKPFRTREVLYIAFNQETQISSSPPPQEALLLEICISVPRSCQQAQPWVGWG